MTITRKPTPDECPNSSFHGNPFRYCGICDWVEEELGPKEAAIEKSPEYVLDLVRALTQGETLDFQGHKVPLDVQELLKEWGPRPHLCFIDVGRDMLAYSDNQYLVGCRCHDGNTYQIWQPGDPPFVCRVSGAKVVDPRTLMPPDDKA